MNGNLDELRRLARTGLEKARAVLGHVRALSVKAWAATRTHTKNGWAWMRETTRTGAATSGAAIKRGWISFRDSWTKQDWFAGIKPLPPGMAGNLTAIAIVTSLVLTSLVYGDYWQRRVAEARLIPSGEHPLQQTEPLPAEPVPPTPEVPTEPVPEPATPDASPAPGVPMASADLPQQGEAFIDRFDGDSLSERWFVSDGWTNGDWMENDWQASQVSITEDGVRLTMGPAVEGSKKSLSSAEIRTHEFYRYGYFEVRMRVPAGSGTVTGAFTYAEQKGRTRPNEIDIEILGRNPRTLEATIHENGKPTGDKLRLPFDTTTAFHTYGFDWTRNYVRWYVDGKLVHQITGAPAARLTRPQQFFVNLWASKQLKDWVGPLDTSKKPWTLDVACVAYAKSYKNESLCR